jgi:hypothetical protein
MGHRIFSLSTPLDQLAQTNVGHGKRNGPKAADDSFMVAVLSLLCAVLCRLVVAGLDMLLSWFDCRACF